MSFPLLEHNRLTRLESNIWRSTAENGVDYSDGDDAEEYLKDVILNSRDLTSLSLELEKNIRDWISEYHFSPQRGNLFRAINLNGIKHALELGSGCGSITRYLGELNIHVDAIEGNSRRAEITRLRCRDLENVNVINANFNKLIFPNGAYDAIFLIGVLEYAKTFLPNAVSNKNAVISILDNIKPALKNGGVLFVAIENRMGLKYWMGASEDHCGKACEGLYGYPQDKGVRTYDKREWDQILENIKIKYYKFIYPFPDYKLPRVLLSDTYIKNDKFAYSNLYRIFSRDYINVWQSNCDEFLVWESLQRSGYLEELANSFLIVLSDSRECLNSIMPYDFVHFSDTGRRPEYRTMTAKPRNKRRIIKKRLAETDLRKKDGLIRHNLIDSRYYNGPLLSSIWIHSIAECNDAIHFEKMLCEYYSFILEYFNNNEELYDAFDMLPFNIILDDIGSYKVIDNEWILARDISPEYVLFRALLWFSCYNKKLLSRICEIKNLWTVKEFIEYCFSVVSLTLNQKLDQFIDLEQQVQTELTFQKEQDFIRKMLDNPIVEISFDTRLRDKDKIIEEQAQQIEHKCKYIANLEQTLVQKNLMIHEKDTYLIKVESELNTIKQSKVWQTAEVFRRLFAKARPNGWH